MEYSEIDLDFLIGIPQLVTNITIADSLWIHGKVGISDQGIWLPKDDGWETIPLKSIELVNRKLPQSVVNRIMSSSRHANYIVVDYKKRSLFGNSYVTSSMIFTGERNNIEKFKSYLLTLLGFSADAEFEQLTPEQSRLLVLIASGITGMDLLLPIFDNDRILLKHAFNVLKKKKLVDEFAVITQSGFLLVEELKGKGEGSIGKDMTSNFTQIAKIWSHTNSFKATQKMNKIAWKYDLSSIMGHVSTEHIWKFLPIEHLRAIKIEKNGSQIANLIMDTNQDVSITLESIEDSITFALFDILDRNQDATFRLIYAIYLGVKDKKDLSYLCNIEPFAVSAKLEHMIQTEYIDSDLILLPKSIKMIKDSLAEKVKDIDITNVPESERIREMEINYAKKKMMDKLM